MRIGATALMKRLCGHVRFFGFYNCVCEPHEFDLVVFLDLVIVDVFFVVSVTKPERGRQRRRAVRPGFDAIDCFEHLVQLAG